MKHGFIKVAAGAPKIRVADPAYNVGEMIRIAREAAKKEVKVLCFPELSITGYICGDLFFSSALLDGAKNALATYVKETAELDLISFVGLPLEWKQKLFNCAAAVCKGKILGIVPKTNLPGYGEFSEPRYFTPAPAVTDTVTLFEEVLPFGSNMIFFCKEMPSLRIGVEIGEDLSALVPPSTDHTLKGATLICNLAASNETVGKADYRRLLVKSQSARGLCGYLYASSGEGESTTDVVFGGHKLIAENGSVLAENPPFDISSELLISEIDVEKLIYDRRRMNTHQSKLDGNYWSLPFSLSLAETNLTRTINPQPFIPADASERDNRCREILAMQTAGLKQRIERAFAKKIVVGISGGLDSTLALLVMARAMDALNRPRTDILAVTMPCFGTTSRTKNNATVLCEELGVEFRQVDIFDAVNRHFKDIGHDPAVRDVTYENSQARERTQILMDIANDCDGMVIGTGDLSELALGWATYNGDHMSMYGVNAGVPKTLIRHIVAYSANEFEANGKPAVAAALRDVLDTPVSPELLPADADGKIAQKTEDLVGPYEIHDFYLYYMIRYGFSPEKLYRMAQYALGEAYDKETLLKWLKVFIRRFFTQQFKRSCLPDGPKVGSVSFSPRGDWKMPSDASFALWMAEAEALQ
ncbi:MAG: NAD(+) synthase [Ruminococcaceae bacterium]|nr:NAD(+) synthase [Oscillospiraceae bacterium]